MAKHMQSTLALLAFSLVTALPATAQDKLSTPVTYNPQPTLSRFEVRINHIKEQTALAESKGWITSEQAGQFKADYDRISSNFSAAKQHPIQLAEDLDLEKQVTALHHNLHSAIAIGSTPKAPPPPAESPKPSSKSSRKKSK